MTLDFASIPSSDDELNETGGHSTSGRLLGSAARRRTVLRSVGLAGATAGAVILGWSPLSKARKASAEVSPSGLIGWDANDCSDAYPYGYDEEPDTIGEFVDEPAACYGGRVMGSTLCDETGWHRADREYYNRYVRLYYRPISTACGMSEPKNAWKWTVDGVTYRCSDGVTTVVSRWWERYSYLSICRARVEESAGR
ncbi:MAG: hypothetical protein CSA58_09005 [Micrococcales bacterium]|nr:MAG: hypothetical protein CSB46_08040 [Micrococcales bacterium]PIE26523.1 MAG: hypothetical protein CSA58_09005 [Micrococcales bacterium]